MCCPGGLQVEACLMLNSVCLASDSSYVVTPVGLPGEQADFIGRAQEGGSLLPVNSNGCRRTRRGQAARRRVLPNLQQNNYRVTY